MHRRKRHHEILARVNRHGFATVAELVAGLAASEATVRRDIAGLAERGLVKRVRGGVEQADAPALRGRPLDVSQTLRVAEKRAIGRAAAALCQPGDSLAINGGSTTGMMAQFLAAEHLHILTNALPIADHLIRHTRNRVLVPGGEVFRDQSIVLSPFEHDSLDGFYAARVFIGAQSIGRRGLMETDSLLIRAVHTLMRQSDQVVGLVDSSKFDHHGNLVLCALAAIDVIVTDSGITPEHRAMLREAGIELVVADPEPLPATA